ncbi:pilus assembly FimT family protein [Meiothermus cerbereus]|uniref:pilus assembly FimT family protein n=1 Tax=Meiothermus cerbereus TaxID=65552 RepID=UPI00048757D9|nr:type II secretion system protein [Meiothermus cerbereus]
MHKKHLEPILLQRSGLTFVEILVVMAIFGILLTIAAVNLNGARQRALVREAAASVATALLQARSEAQRYNSNVVVALETGGTAFTITQLRSGTPVSRTVRLPAGTLAEVPAGGPSTVIYRAPFGVLDGGGAAFCFRLASQVAPCSTATTSAPRSIVGIVGLVGKVVVFN